MGAPASTKWVDVRKMNDDGEELMRSRLVARDFRPRRGGPDRPDLFPFVHFFNFLHLQIQKHIHSGRRVATVFRSTARRGHHHGVTTAPRRN